MSEGSTLRIGYPKEQEEFFRRFSQFIKAQPALLKACEEAASMAEPKTFVSRLVYYHTRLVFEDFNDIVLLVANGRTAGAMKILRGMFERAVTGEYLHLNPNEAKDYWDFYLVSRRREVKAIQKYFPGTLPAKEVSRVESDYKKVKSKYKRPTNWIDKGIVQMAEEVSAAAPPGTAGFETSIVPGYYFPMQETHSTVGAILRRTRSNGRSYWYEEGARKGEDINTLVTAHYLVLKALDLIRKHFELIQLEAPIKDRLQEYKEIWTALGVRIGKT